MKSLFKGKVVCIVAGIAFSGCGGKFNFRSAFGSAADEESEVPALVPSEDAGAQEDKAPVQTIETTQHNETAADVTTDPGQVVVPAPPPAVEEHQEVSAPHPDPAAVAIVSAQFAGTACVGGTGGLVELSADLSEVKVTWPSEIVSEVGPGVSLQRSRKQCSVSLITIIPADWVFRLKTVALSASSILEAGVTATSVAQAYFQGSAVTADFASERLGPLDLSEVITGDLLSEWSPLNLQRALNLKLDSRLAVDSTVNAAGRGLHTVQAISIYGIEWENHVP